MVFMETLILFFRSSLMYLKKFSSDTGMYIHCVDPARGVATHLKLLGSTKAAKRRKQRLPYRMGEGYIIE